MSPKREKLKVALEWGAAAVTLVASAPVLAGLSALVSATSRGGPFYISRRIGKAGKVFGCVKLRTMTPGAPLIVDADAKTIVRDDDPRLTAVGRWLRHGLDELPQLWNVMRGEMSLIGPRPDADWMLPRYTDTIRKRHAIRPGITGLAQVLDSRGSLSTPQGYAVDVWYIEHHSFVLDAWIAAATVLYIAGRRDIGEKRLEALRAAGVLDAEAFAPLPLDAEGVA